jgi:hypothetical protein
MSMPDKETADLSMQVDPMDRGHLADEDLEIASGGVSDIKPPTLAEPSDGSGGS